MKSMSKKFVLSVAMALAAAPAFAGGFVELATSDPLRVDGAALNAEDPLFLGFDSTFSGLLPSQFIELASRATTVIDDESGQELGVFHDRVFRDTTDNRLVFGSRIELTLDENGFNPFEINDIQRAGFTGYSAAVAWWDATGSDYRLKSAARTAQGLVKTEDGILPDTFDADIVDMRTDASGPEGNPLSGWYLVKTDAVGYSLMNAAANVYTANEDVSPDVEDRWIAAFAPMAPVPEPSEYALFLAGLGVLGIAMRRRKS
jgi:hypothetical protein